MQVRVREGGGASTHLEGVHPLAFIIRVIPVVEHGSNHSIVSVVHRDKTHAKEGCRCESNPSTHPSSFVPARAHGPIFISTRFALAHVS